MKKLFSKFIVLVLLVVGLLNLFGCSNDNSNKDNSNNSVPDISTEDKSSDNNSTEDDQPKEEVKATVIKLTKQNYDSYLNISITQTAQSQTLLYHTYFVCYRDSSGRQRYDYYDGLTPPTSGVVKCTYSSSTYSVSTTFTINCYSKNKDYIFLNSNFSAQAGSSTAMVYISQDGSGSNVLMMSEKLKTPNKDYSLQTKDVVRSFTGEVSFYEKK